MNPDRHDEVSKVLDRFEAMTVDEFVAWQTTARQETAEQLRIKRETLGW